MDIEAICERYLIEGPRASIKIMIQAGHRHTLVINAVTDWYEGINQKPALADSKEKPALAVVKPKAEPAPLVAVTNGPNLFDYYNPVKWPAIDELKLNKPLRQEYNAAKTAYVECKRLHAALPEYKDATERHNAALTIVQKMKNNARTLARCRFFIANGSLPVVDTAETLDETDPVAVYESLRNTRTYVSRYKNKAGKEALYAEYVLKEKYLTQLYDELKKASKGAK